MLCLKKKHKNNLTFFFVSKNIFRHWQKTFTFNPLMLRLLSSKAQGRKDFWKPSKPCHIGICWKALSTLRWVPHARAFCMVKLETCSIRVKALRMQKPWYWLSHLEYHASWQMDIFPSLKAILFRPLECHRIQCGYLFYFTCSDHWWMVGFWQHTYINQDASIISLDRHI